MSNTCSLCGVASAVGALLCNGCGAPLAMVPQGAAANVASPAVSPVTPIGIVAPPQRASALSLVENGVASTSRVIELPHGDFALTLGRHDLVSNPPVVVDVDLSSYCAAVALPDGSKGYTVSRRHCVVARERGALSIASVNGAKTLVRDAGAQDFVALVAGTPRVLAPGARVVLGVQSPLIVEVV